jgi:hypothetical protein
MNFYFMYLLTIKQEKQGDLNRDFSKISGKNDQNYVDYKCN